MLWGTTGTAQTLAPAGAQPMVAPLANAVTLALAEPLTASVLGIVLLGERLTSQSTAGMALIPAGLVVITVRRSGIRAPVQ